MKEILVIGAGFAGLSAALHLARSGFRVRVIEQNELPGGRARYMKSNDFLFDMGPSWYWMPDVFEKFFQSFGHQPGDFYKLKRLDPGYRMFFSETDVLDVPASQEELFSLFENLEKGSAQGLKKFLSSAQYKYDVGINRMVYLPGRSPFELFRWDLLSGALRLDATKSLSSSVAKVVGDHRLQQLLEFPVLFLGATAKDTPALYSLMNYADLVLGTWYPMGGMFKVIEAMLNLAGSLGVEVITGTEVTALETNGSKISKVHTSGETYQPDIVVGAADYHHIEQKLLPPSYRRYSEKYWERRKMAPSALMFFLGLDTEVPHLLHHNLLFDEDYKKHAEEIYDHPAWPEHPALYVSCTSKTDRAVAPAGSENLTVLIPVAPGLRDTPEIRERYYTYVIKKLARFSGKDLGPHIVVKHSYAHSDFIRDYHSYKGNAYGLANTLSQTAFLKPKMYNGKVRNLYFTGQLTVPGPGVPPSLISGQVVASEIVKRHLKA